MSKTIRMTRALSEALAPAIAAGHGLDDLLETLLYEVPDEAMEAYAEMADPVEVQVSDRVHSLVTQIADAFGLSPLGLTVLLAKVQARTFELASRYRAFTEGNT